MGSWCLTAIAYPAFNRRGSGSTPDGPTISCIGLIEPVVTSSYEHLQIYFIPACCSGSNAAFEAESGGSIPSVGANFN